jgi:hypothetical protein
MSGMLGNQRGLVLETQQQRRHQHKAPQVECERTIPEGRAGLETQAPLRPPIDCIAEGMWRLAAGQCCQESWLMLPEDQRAWWRSYAAECVRRWMTDAIGSCH